MHVLEQTSVTMTTVRLGLNLVVSMTGRTYLNDAPTPSSSAPTTKRLCSTTYEPRHKISNNMV